MHRSFARLAVWRGPGTDVVEIFLVYAAKTPDYRGYIVLSTRLYLPSNTYSSKDGHFDL